MDEDGNFISDSSLMKKVGTFKANIKVYNEENLKYYKQYLESKFSKVNYLLHEFYDRFRSD